MSPFPFSRVFVPPANISSSRITIDDPDAVHHLRTVLRVSVGDRLVCVDGQGQEYEGVIAKHDARHLIVRVDARRACAETGPALWLAAGLPKGGRFDWVVEKATELGASRIAPLLTQHTVVRMTAGGSASKLTRWRRIAAAAARQCQRAILPVIDPPQTLESFLATIPSGSLILMPTLQVVSPPLSDVLGAAGPAAAPPRRPSSCRGGPSGHRRSALRATEPARSLLARKCRRTQVLRPGGGGPGDRARVPTAGGWATGVPDAARRTASASPAAPQHGVSAEHPVVLLIGPEGDFSKDEVALAQAQGAQPVSLGALTLRSETAALATLAMVRYAFGCP